ncbi:glycosyltransferase [Microbacterium sp. WCS2018Hpa-23]|uniref:glycosyltransferase n=1 Tax=Microbacterium sp. WCS2018Hpa-23 TaxID=3073634 RepID=UPI0028834E47|nr:glycosyltransferase [Microbacterium sp. WCS2018Hpa-23]
MFLAPLRLPRARHFALTWGIADQHGGMTSAMLRRSRSFHELGGVDVDILTLDDRADYADLEERLRASGELIDGVRIRNLWDDLRDRTLRPAAQAPDARAPLVPEPDDEVIVLAGAVMSRTRRDASGRVVAVDRFRRDGSLLSTERSEADQRIVLYDADGRAVRSWRTSRGLHRWWLDRLTAGAPSFLVVDSKTAARSVLGYRRQHVVTIHIIHASHRLGGRAGALRASRASVLRRADEFDGIVVLTERQRTDLVEDLSTVGVEARIRTIPNGVELPSHGPSERDGTHAVIVASLNRRKRLEHAVDALVTAQSDAPGIHADIFGEGPDEEQLRQRIHTRDAASYIRLRGHDPLARSAFESAGFSLLTSTSEGLPLVLAESMAVGCLPIAYDIRYGPADIIRDGVDGFLVPKGDVAALSRTIAELQTMPRAGVDAMRQRAVSRAKDFSDAAVTRRWSRELHAVYDAKLLAAAKEQPLRVRLRRRAGVLRRRIRWVTGR